VTATNFGMDLLIKGVPRADCIVPVIGNTGLHFVAGARIVLDGSFPTLIPISKYLDLSDPIERQVASTYIAKASSHCENLFSLIGATSAVPLVPLSLTVNGLYYIKTLSPEVYRLGLGLFASHELNCLDIEIGMHHIIDALNLVYGNSEARRFAEYTLCPFAHLMRRLMVTTR
jgi:hypothetical protein